MIKETLLVSTFGLLGLVTVACGSQKKDQTAEAVSETAWCLDGFERPTGVNPVIKPLPTKFYCPMREDSVAWEESDTFNPAATIYDGKIVVMYRAEDNSAQGIGSRTSRLGYATSTDGIHFERDTKPAFYPAKDNQVENECPGGTEDPRIAMTEDGTYVLLYTQWNRKVPRLAVATSKDLKHWTKFGPAFEKAYNGKFKDEATKSASLVTTLKGDITLNPVLMPTFIKCSCKSIIFNQHNPRIKIINSIRNICFKNLIYQFNIYLIIWITQKIHMQIIHT